MNQTVSLLKKTVTKLEADNKHQQDKILRQKDKITLFKAQLESKDIQIQDLTRQTHYRSEQSDPFQKHPGDFDTNSLQELEDYVVPYQTEVYEQDPSAFQPEVDAAKYEVPDVLYYEDARSSTQNSH